MHPEMRRRLKRGSLISSLILANLALLFSLAFQSGVVYSSLKALVIFAVMYYVCRSVLYFWDKASVPADKGQGGDIRTTMDMLEDLDEKGIRFTYNPLKEEAPESAEGTAPADPAETVPGQINVDAMTIKE